MASGANVVAGSSDSSSALEGPKTRHSTMQTRSSSPPSSGSSQVPVPGVILTGSDSPSCPNETNPNQLHGGNDDREEGLKEQTRGKGSSVSLDQPLKNPHKRTAGARKTEKLDRKNLELSSEASAISKRSKEEVDSTPRPAPGSVKRRRVPARKAATEAAMSNGSPSLRSGAQYGVLTHSCKLILSSLSSSLLFHPISPLLKKLALDHNKDYCETCNGIGEFLCCETCPVAMHFICADPPVLTVPEGDWFCRNCTDKKKEEEKKAKGLKADEKPGPFDRFSQFIRRRNPSIFVPPAYIRSVFPDVGINERGEYLSIRDYRPSRTDFREDGNELKKLHDPKGKVRLCYHCSKSAIRGRMVSCDYCPLHWHLNCLGSASIPPARRKWRCPAHVEHATVQPKKVPSKGKAIQVAPERAPIDGDYEVIGQDEWLDPRLINQPYQVSASSIVRNFLQSVSSSSGSQLNQETEKAFHLTKSEMDVIGILSECQMSRRLQDEQVRVGFMSNSSENARVINGPLSPDPLKPEEDHLTPLTKDLHSLLSLPLGTPSPEYLERLMAVDRLLRVCGKEEVMAFVTRVLRKKGCLEGVGSEADQEA
ncbi:MAG: hypothetical protein DHS80DRAFT_22624 [Piptocephalis tieghemiana]|nr:MAG: hypothetical protein DHS80DRAFT_22624 [Piptocephalis tieghemiana]